ncbi:hypothetical protein F4824DRAFT_498340 [Ustulina deusta]|nr:hypothetical protein F4824DRAFT_498340 [Ustulina deusta]
MSTTNGRIRIAIIGVGLARATIAAAVVRNPRLDVNAYKLTPDFSGQAILELKVGAAVMDEDRIVLVRIGQLRHMPHCSLQIESYPESS